LWVVPFISPDSGEFREAERLGYLIKTKSGESFISHWWDGYSAVVDFSNPAAVQWFYGKLYALRKEYGVYGFKFDAGDSRLYADDIVTVGGTTPNRQSECYAARCTEFPVNEIRACCKCAGLPIIQRIADRRHSWDAEGGLGGLIPKAIAQGLFGYPYLCPDMIGGGQYVDFAGVSPESLDEELMIRYCQCACLMPIMQFSYPMWANLSARALDAGKACIDLRTHYADYILETAKHASKTGEPILRSLEYAYSLPDIGDEFMLGEKLLVAPVLQKGATSRAVYLPDGKWKYMPDGRTYEGGRVEVNAPIEVLPYFEKIL
jgi:alpha-glucosidase (family GH31 glycosyl hydrolase)